MIRPLIRNLILSIIVLWQTPSATRGETVKDREGAVRGDRARMENDSRWIYNDVRRGFAEAGRTGKPLLVVLRCVPCLSCMGIDATILTSQELQPVLDQFVCVRVINANDLDLSLFQFDYDLSFSTMFFNADGTVYGRYGSWKHQRDAQNATIAGYKAALLAAADLHRGYPQNKALLAGKQGGPVAFKVPVEIPELAGKYERELKWDGKVVQSCVHCHQIGDAFRAFHRKQGAVIPDELIYPMPAPETIGLTLEPDQIATIAAVAPGSVAERAGLKPGGRIIAADGQPLISIADFAWVLHRFSDAGTLKLQIRGDDETRDVPVLLESGWRRNADISTRVGTWPMRAMAAGGLVLVELTEEERQSRGIVSDSMALKIKAAGAYGAHAAAKNAGFQKDDVLLAVGEMRSRTTESKFIGDVLRRFPTKQQVRATVLRGNDRIELDLPVQ